MHRMHLQVLAQQKGGEMTSLYEDTVNEIAQRLFAGCGNDTNAAMIMKVTRGYMADLEGDVREKLAEMIHAAKRREDENPTRDP